MHPSLTQRKIIHVDMDAYYAMVEVLDNPDLKGLPLIVGGSPQSRGVVCTASYEARKFGVRSAMSCAKAARLCPDGVFVRPRFDRYVEISQQIRAIFRRYTHLVEPLSLDEAYLDVTDNALGLYAVAIAKLIRADIADETHLTASAGVAPNKMLAKIASDLNKPNGLAVILPDQVEEFVKALPLRRIHGIGKVSAAKLSGLGLDVCADVTAKSLGDIQTLLGNGYGEWLYQRAQGLDDRSVETDRVRKSFGEESTYAKDLTTADDVRRELAAITKSLAASLCASEVRGRTIQLKVRYRDFTTVTRAVTIAEFTDDEGTILKTSLALLDKTAACVRGVRLLGISLSKLEGEGTEEARAPSRTVQRSLFGD